MSQRMKRLIAAFASEHRGVAAVEFGFILPIMAVLLVCTIELSQAVNNYRKVTLLARTVSDLTAQGDTDKVMTTATMNDILAASTLVLVPFGAGTAQIKVSAMGVYPTLLGTKPYVCSSAAKNTTARTKAKTATDLTVPAPFQVNGMRYILTEVTMPYAPILGTAMDKLLNRTLAVTFQSAMPWPVRGGAPQNSIYTEIILPGGDACPTTPT